MLLQFVQVVELGNKAYEHVCCVMTMCKQASVSRTVFHRTCSLLPASMVVPTAKAKALTAVQTRQDQKGLSEKQSTCSCQAQDLLNASKLIHTHQPKALMAMHPRTEASWPMGGDQERQGWCCMKSKTCPMEIIRKAGLLLHEGQNMPNGDYQKGRAAAA